MLYLARRHGPIVLGSRAFCGIQDLLRGIGSFRIGRLFPFVRLTEDGSAALTGAGAAALKETVKVHTG